MQPLCLDSVPTTLPDTGGRPVLFVPLRFRWGGGNGGWRAVARKEKAVRGGPKLPNGAGAESSNVGLPANGTACRRGRCQNEGNSEQLIQRKRINRKEHIESIGNRSASRQGIQWPQWPPAIQPRLLSPERTDSPYRQETRFPCRHPKRHKFEKCTTNGYARSARTRSKVRQAFPPLAPQDRANSADPRGLTTMVFFPSQPLPNARGKTRSRSASPAGRCTGP